MKNNMKYIFMALMIVAGITSACNRAFNRENDKVNVIIILADDLGYGDLSCYGNPIIRTPHLDRMGEEGIRLTSFNMAASSCTPSRASLLTGRYPVRSGLPNVLGPGSDKGIPAEELTLAEYFKDAGYRTAIFGKWHLGDKEEFLPLQHGFDEYFGIPYSNDMEPPFVQTDIPLSLWEGNDPVEHPVDQHFLTKRYTERAINFIEKNRDNPFFLYLAHSMPHMPVFCSPGFSGKSRGGIYGDVIEEIDWSVGEIFMVLKKTGLDKNTLVIFTSDNGPWSNAPDRMIRKGNEKHHAGTAGLLAGTKGTPWDGGHRVPCLVWYPGNIPAGQVSPDLATSMDIFPTVISLAGLPVPDKVKLDGHDLSAFLKGQAVSPTNEFVYFLSNNIAGIRKGPWKLFLDEPVGWPANGEITGSYRLYHMEWDPGERYDFSDKYPEIAEDLKAEIERFR